MNFKKKLSAFLAVAMVLSSASVTVFAEDVTPGVTAPPVTATATTVNISQSANADGSVTVTMGASDGSGVDYMSFLDGVTSGTQTYTTPVTFTAPGSYIVVAGPTGGSLSQTTPSNVQFKIETPVVGNSADVPTAMALNDGVMAIGTDQDIIPKCNATYSKSDNSVIMTDTATTGANIYYAMSNTGSENNAAVAALQGTAATYSGPFVVTQDSDFKYLYVWHSKSASAADKFQKITVNISVETPQVEATYNNSTKQITLADKATTGNQMYYYTSTTDEGNAVANKQSSANPYSATFTAPGGSNIVYVTVWHSKEAFHKDKYVTIPVQVTSPIPKVKLSVNATTKLVNLEDTANTGLPIYYYYDGMSGVPEETTESARQAAAKKYDKDAGFYVESSYDTRDIYLWHSKDSVYSANTQKVLYYRNQDAPAEQIKPGLTYDGTNLKLGFDYTNTNPLFKVYYQVTVNTSKGSIQEYVSPFSLAKGSIYDVEAFYSSDNGMTKNNTVNYHVELDAEGNFSTIGADKALSVVAKGKYLLFSGPSASCQYEVSVFNADSGSKIQSFTETLPFSDKVIALDSSVVNYRVEYLVTENGKIVALNKGKSAPVDVTYMPEPFNLKWDPTTSKATAEISLPADTVEYELFNKDSNTSYQKNTTGEFTNVPSGKYDLNAVAYSSTDDTLRSKITKLSIVVDNDKPTLTLIPMSVAGSTPGVLVQAEDLGSGINRIEVKINNKPQANVQTGAMIYCITEGVNTFVVTAFDNMGNSTVANAELKFDKSLLNPVITVANDTDGKVWFKEKVSVSVTASNAATKLQYLVITNGAATLKMEQKNPAEATITATVDLEKDGIYEIGAHALSPGGLPSGSEVKRTIKIDTIAPTDPEIYVNDKGMLTINSTDAGSGIDRIEYTAPGQKKANYTNEVRIKGEGDITITATAYDKAGNMSKAVSYTATIDTLPPDEPTIDGPTGEWVTSEEPISVTITPGTDGGKDSKVKTFYRIGSESSSKGWSTYKDGTEITVENEGITKISAYCQDDAGNQSETVTAYVKIDYTAPSMRGVATTTFTNKVSRASFRVYFHDDGSGVDKLYVSVNGKESKVNLGSKNKTSGYVNLTLELPPVQAAGTVAQASTGDADTNGPTIDPTAHIVGFRLTDKAGNESKIELNSALTGKTNPSTGG